MDSRAFAYSPNLIRKQTDWAKTLSEGYPAGELLVAVGSGAGLPLELYFRL